jgi:ABC-type antimicrobial peptide transport system permease subunit
MLSKYFKIAWRNFARDWITAAINMLGLAIGICACMVIYLIAHFELSYEDFQPEGDRVYRAVMDVDFGSGEVSHIGNLPYYATHTIRTQFTGIDKVAGFFNYYFSVTVPDGSKRPKHFDANDPSIDYRSNMIITDPEYFSIFRYEWLAGNAETALNEPFEVVLAESKAQSYFGAIPADQMLGRDLIYNDSLHLRVTGIVKDLPGNTDFIFKDFISLSTIKASFLNTGNYLRGVTDDGYTDFGQVFIKLSKGEKSGHFDAQTPVLRAQFMQQHFQKFAKKANYHLQPLSDIHFNSDYHDFYSRHAQLPMLYGLIGIAAFILIIAAVNFANLATAQATKRTKEIGIRKVMGSTRINLAIQFLCEAFLMTIFAAILSLVLLQPALAVFHDIVPRELVFTWQNPALFACLAGVTAITAILAGIYPAKVLSSYRPVQCLKDQEVGPGGHKNYVRKGLIVFQFAVSLFFIIGTLVIDSQLHFMLNKDLGFRKDSIIDFDINPKLPGEKKYLLAEEIRKLAGVDMVSVSQDLPQSNDSRGGGIYCKDKGTVIQETLYRAGDEYFVPLFGLKVVAGRNLIPPTGRDSITEFLINETEARQLGFQKPKDAIGHTIQTGAFGSRPFYVINTGPVVGILADYNSQPLNTAIPPTSIMASKDLYYGLINVRLSTQGRKVSDLSPTIAAIGKEWSEIYPTERFEYVFFDSVISSYYTGQQTMLHTINLASMMAIFISCLGLFGISAFIIVRRTKEIGIRKVLGASVTSIVSIMVKEFVVLVGLATVIATPIAWFLMHRWLDDFAYRVALNLWIFLLAGLSAVVIALVTVGYHSIKAALANPIDCLKTEG